MEESPNAGPSDDAEPGGEERVTETVRRIVERAGGLDGGPPDPAFRAAEPVDRDDPHDAVATAIRAASAPDGPLADLAVAVKDNVAVRGVTHTAGTDALSWRPEADAAVVERLRAAGADLRATTRMDAFAMGVTGESCASGPTTNPAAPGHVPGGSSSGSAAVVAADRVDAAVGTDTAGSVRVPAAFCGVVGVKPTYDRVPRTGVVDLAPSLDHVGVLASDVDTAARTLSVIAGSDPRRPETLTADATPGSVSSSGATAHDGDDPLRLAVPEPFVAVAEPGVRAAVEDALADLAARAGVLVEHTAFPEHDDAEFTNQVHTLSEFAATFDDAAALLSGLVARRPEARAAVASVSVDDLPDRVARLVRVGRRLNRDHPSVVGDAWRQRRRVIRRTRALFGSFDALVTPTTPMPAPAFGAVGPDGAYAVADVLANTAPFDLTGQPAVSVPVGAVDGRPVGLQVVASGGADARALELARLVERTVGGA
jgi:Asp-tRNA(Asn)/Glu-tRNA(Gln) amidotransferase A subunit family amidase